MNKKQRELKAAWDKICAANSKPLERGAKAKAMQVNSVKPSKMPKLVIPQERNSRTIASFDSGKGSTPQRADKIYTGSKMLGIGVLHKSNGIPIFNHDAVEDLAKMRR